MAPSTTAADAAPFVAALTAANLPDWLRWTVAIRPRRRTLGLTVEPGGAVTVAVPPGATPARVVSFIQSSLGRLRPMVRQSEKVVATNPVKELINGEGFNLIGTPYRLHLVDDSDTGKRCGCQCGRLITAHPGVPIIGEPGHPGWSSGRRYQLTMRRDARSALTVVDWYRREGQAWIDKHAPALVSRLGVTPAPTFRVRGLDTRAPRTWATYLPRTHTISVHWALFQAPRELVEYVIAHEIAHAARPKGKPHGRQWQNLVARLVFDWKDKQARLNEAGRAFWWGHMDEAASPVPQPCTTTRQEHLPMPAEGKNNAAGIAADVAAGKTVRILITDSPYHKHASPAALNGDVTPGKWYPSSVKTKVVTATVTGSTAAMFAGRRARREYTLHTDKGDVPGLAPIQTVWLAPEPAVPVAQMDPKDIAGIAASIASGTAASRQTPDIANIAASIASGTAACKAAPVATSADVTAVEVDGTIVAFTSRVDLTAPAADEPAAPFAEVTADRAETPVVDGWHSPAADERVMARLRETAETEPAPPVAHRATMSEARRHFEAGGAVLVHERGNELTVTVHRTTTTHDQTRTTWDELAAMVTMWRNRYPRQRFYIVPAAPIVEPEPAADAAPDDGHRCEPRSAERFSRKTVTILCDRRHVVDTIPAAEWAGSVMEARVGQAQAAVRQVDAGHHEFAPKEPGSVFCAAPCHYHELEPIHQMPDAAPDLVGKWLTRSDHTVGQVATVEQFRGALGNDKCTGVTYTDGVSETYRTIYLPEPVPAPETAAEPTASGETRTDPAAALRAAAELDWPDTDSTIYRGSVGRYLREQAERHAGTPAAGEFHTLANEWPDEGVTEWRRVRRMLLDRADQIDAQTAGSPAEPPRYAVGDRVLVRGAGDKTDVGIVDGVNDYPDEDIPTHYDVHIIPAGTVPVFAEDLSPAPVPEPGQRWVSTSPDRANVLTVIGPSPDKNYPAGLVTDCEEVRGILLSLPHWRPLDESDPADQERLRVSALVRLPQVAAILKRAAKLTGDERAALTNAGMSHHRVFRDAQTDLSSRVARAYGEHWRDLFAVKRHALDVAGASEAKRVAAELDGAYLFAPHAVAYAVFAEVARSFLDDNEYRIFAGPWLDVIGVRA